MRNVAHTAERAAVVACLEVFRHRCLLGCPNAAVVAVVNGQCLHRGRLLQFVLQPIGFSVVAERQHGTQFRHRPIVLADAHGQHAAVAVEALVLLRFGQRHLHAAATLHDGVAPDQFLHGLLGFHPRTAGVAPARTTGNGHLHAERIGQRGGEAKTVLPLGRHVDEATLDDGLLTHACLETVHAADAHTMHPLEVFADAVAGDVAVHPVPPHTWTRFLRRCEEVFPKVLCRSGGGKQQSE